MCSKYDSSNAIQRQEICLDRIFFSAAGSKLKEILIMASAFRLPTVNQLITLAIGLVILFLLLGFAPENIKKFFRV